MTSESGVCNVCRGSVGSPGSGPFRGAERAARTRWQYSCHLLNRFFSIDSIDWILFSGILFSFDTGIVSLLLNRLLRSNRVTVMRYAGGGMGGPGVTVVADRRRAPQVSPTSGPKPIPHNPIHSLLPIYLIPNQPKTDLKMSKSKLMEDL